MVVQVTEACYTNRILVRYRPCRLYPHSENFVWLCVDSGWQTSSAHCKGQAVIALSSGEAEYYGHVSATSQMLGLQSILFDWGWKFGAYVLMDATAGIASGSQRGLG